MTVRSHCPCPLVLAWLGTLLTQELSEPSEMAVKEPAAQRAPEQEMHILAEAVSQGPRRHGGLQHLSLPAPGTWLVWSSKPRPRPIARPPTPALTAAGATRARPRPREGGTPVALPKGQAHGLHLTPSHILRFRVLGMNTQSCDHHHSGRSEPQPRPRRPPSPRLSRSRPRRPPSSPG